MPHIYEVLTRLQARCQHLADISLPLHQPRSVFPSFPPYCCLASSIHLVDDVTSSVRPAGTP